MHYRAGGVVEAHVSGFVPWRFRSVFALSPAALLGLALLATPAEATARTPLPTCETGTRHVELTAEAPGEVHEVCVHPGRPTSFFFDAKLARVELAGSERFRVIAG